MCWEIHRAICVCDNHSAPSPECQSTDGDARGGVPPSPLSHPRPGVSWLLQCLLLPLTPGSVAQRKRGYVFNFQACPVIPLFCISFYTLGLCWFSGRCCSFFCPSRHLLQNKSFSLHIYKQLSWFSFFAMQTIRHSLLLFPVIKL